MINLLNRLEFCIFILCLFFVFFSWLSSVCLANTDHGCPQEECVSCDEHNTTRCRQCRVAIVVDTRVCVRVCPRPLSLVHSDIEGYDGLLCRQRHFLDAGDITTSELAWLLSVLLVTAVTIGVAVGACLQQKARHLASTKNNCSRSFLLHNQHHHCGFPEHGELSFYERDDIWQRLKMLRPHLCYFLGLFSTAKSQYLATVSYVQHDHSCQARLLRKLLRDLDRLIYHLNHADNFSATSVASGGHFRRTPLASTPAYLRKLLIWAEELVRKAHVDRQLYSQAGFSPAVSWFAVPVHRWRSCSTNKATPTNSAAHQSELTSADVTTTRSQSERPFSCLYKQRPLATKSRNSLSRRQNVLHEGARPTYRDWWLSHECHLAASRRTSSSSLCRTMGLLAHPPGNRFPIRLINIGRSSW